MSTSSCESESTDKKQPVLDSASAVEPISSNPIEKVDSTVETEDAEDRGVKEQTLRNPMLEIDTEGEIEPQSPTVVPTVSVAEDLGHGSSVIQSDSDSNSSGTQQLQADSVVDTIMAVTDDATSNNAPAVVNTETTGSQSTSKADAHSNQSGTKAKSGREAAKEEKREEKKKSKKKEDKSVEYILRALNSLQSPEEKLAALCKKYADLNEEHRVLQSSFKTQQHTLTVVVREKDQLQSEHTKAMIAKSKLESLCRELQKHNKIIKDESIKRAKEDDEKRKEISAQFNVTICEIQDQMSDNSEKNNRLRKENDNLAEQLRTFISQCHGRDEHVKKLQEHHDLENKLAEAKLAQAEAILRELEERTNKEKELMFLKLTEMTKKAQITESQLELYKSKYDEFSTLHTRSSETFQKYKVEMDKMTKRIKKLEKDGLQWKSKWESTSRALIEQYEARSKSEQETTVYAQKLKRLESLCRALQAELHGKKVVLKETDEGEDTKPSNIDQDNSTPPSVAPANCPEASSLDQYLTETVKQISLSEPAVNSSQEPSTSSSATSSLDLPSVISPEPDTSAVKVVSEAAETGQNCSEKDEIPDSLSIDFGSDSLEHTDGHKDVASTLTQPVLSEYVSGGDAEKPEAPLSEVTV